MVIEPQPATVTREWPGRAPSPCFPLPMWLLYISSDRRRGEKPRTLGSLRPSRTVDCNLGVPAFSGHCVARPLSRRRCCREQFPLNEALLPEPRQPLAGQVQVKTGWGPEWSKHMFREVSKVFSFWSSCWRTYELKQSTFCSWKESFRTCHRLSDIRTSVNL